MTFIRLACWIPLLLWIGLNAYVSHFEGWGRWAAAPVLLIPLLTSAAFCTYGLVAVLLNYHRQRFIAKVDFVAAIISGLPVIIVFTRKLI